MFITIIRIVVSPYKIAQKLIHHIQDGRRKATLHYFFVIIDQSRSVIEYDIVQLRPVVPLLLEF